MIVRYFDKDFKLTKKAATTLLRILQNGADGAVNPEQSNFVKNFMKHSKIMKFGKLTVTWAPYTACGEYVDITCPHCNQVEEWPKDEQRWHTQHFDYVEQFNEPKDYTVYECHECTKKFAVLNMFIETPFDGHQGAKDANDDMAVHCDGDYT